MCAGDSTIEPPWVRKDEAGNIIRQGVDGHGVQHTCKDTRLLWETAEKSEEAGIDPWNWQVGDTVERVFG